ncbi:MAG: hypothetical protein GXP39_11795 [Chloroflexi bacterium]|nr:hypothetical protein [Chloroflexota bacterium]
MPRIAPSTCPHLGLVSDRTLAWAAPDAAHRCYAQTPPGTPDESHQQAYCLARAHTDCPYYVSPEEINPQTPPTRRRPQAFTFLAALLAVFIAAAVLVYGQGWATPGLTALLPTATPAITTVPITPMGPSSSNPAQAATPTPVEVPPTPTFTPTSTPTFTSTATRPTTPTPEPGGQILSITPRSGDVGWWASNDRRHNHLGDSFLYAGYFDGQVFVSAIRFDLSRVPRGAPIHGGILQLTGLQADRLDRGAPGTWSVQMLAVDALADFARADFQELFNAPAAVTLFPSLEPKDLKVGKINSWSLDRSTVQWLEQQIADGATEVIVRIIGPTGGQDTLFAWDSGAGPASLGEAPRLILNLGPAPATPPPLPTLPVIVATLTPTPANVLTAAARALTATAVAVTTGTYTPVPGNIVTPTPIPANLATAQALAWIQGLPPIVPSTPTPANAATATAYAARATAIAITTGTFTPTPEGAVTPVIILPTPVPQNALTAAAQLVTATARAKRFGTPTPLPYNAVIATPTPTLFVITSTPTPANAATARAIAAYATAVAMTTGTFTPLPPNAATATPLPLLLYLDRLTPTPPPTPTATIPATMPRELVGKILFFSDRAGEPRIFALDPATGRLAYLTQGWLYQAARAQEFRSPDGRFTLLVQERLVEDSRVPQVYIRDNQFNTTRQLTFTTGWSYDPVWSPLGDRIAFVSTEPGNDEIYTIRPDGSDLRRLTVNSWEWDKHPSWSPDGTQIVFWSNRETGRRQLWIMNADGSNQRRLLDSPYNDWDPVWVK